MAARQDQGLLATLIVFVILFLISFVAAYIGWKSYSEADQRLQAAESQLRESQTAVRTVTDQSQIYLQMMGFGELDNAEDVQKTFDEDMQRFGSSFADESRSYRKILEYVDTENQTIAASEARTKDELSKFEKRLLAVEQEKEAQVVQYRNNMKKAEQDLATERRNFEQDRVRLQKVEQELQSNLSAQRAKFEADIAKLDVKAKELRSKLSNSERARTNLLGQVSRSSDSFEVADGRISSVNQSGAVWINLGSADSLRRQITFSVFDADQRDAGKAAKKGSIEVTRILGEHLAEARVTDDDPRNPILSGDHIYSQVWHRGKKRRFALTGVIDIDGDGRSDLELVRDLVELNGGVVDAYLTETGNIEGEMSVNTRYLVYGEFPDQPHQAAMSKSWSAMISEAKTLGVDTVTLDVFLNQLGYAPSDRVVRLGPGARAEDFPASSGRGPSNPSVRRVRFPAR